MPRLWAALLLMTIPASCEILGISDSSDPHLMLLKDAKLIPLQWHTQEMFFRLVHSSAVRISARGVRFVPQSHHLLLPSSAALWRSSACRKDTECMCVLHTGARFLPDYPLPVYMVPPFLALDDSLGGMAGPGCRDGATGRVVEVGSSRVHDDVSLCNVLSSGSDYVFVPSLGMLYLMVDPISNVVLFVLGILVVYLMVKLGQNLQIIMLAADNVFSIRKSTEWNMAAMLILIITCCFCTSSGYVLEGFITWEDRVVFMALVAHVVYYCIRIQSNIWWGDKRRANPINPMITSISTAVQRVYGTSDNPYSLILFFIMLTWLMHKISMLAHSVVYRNQGDLFGRKWRCLDIIVDSGMICIMVYAGVFVTLHEELFRGTFLLQGILAALTLNRGMLPFHILYSDKQHNK